MQQNKMNSEKMSSLGTAYSPAVSTIENPRSCETDFQSSSKQISSEMTSSVSESQISASSSITFFSSSITTSSVAENELSQDQTLPSDISEITSIEQLKKLLPRKFIKRAYTPTVEKITNFGGDGNFDKFGGFPSFSIPSKFIACTTASSCDKKAPSMTAASSTHHDENKVIYWPRCDICRNDMQFFFQVTSPITKQTFQMFMCLDEKCYMKFYRGNIFLQDRYWYISYINYKSCIPFDQLDQYKIIDKLHSASSMNEVKAKPSKIIYVPPSKLNFLKENAYNSGVNQETYRRSAEIKHLCAHRSPEKFYFCPPGSGEHKNCPYQCYKVTSYQKHIEVGDYISILTYLNKNGIAGDDEDSTLLEMISETQSLSFKFGGIGQTCQDAIDSHYHLHFGNENYLPYMWGDGGYAHISKSLNLYWNCG
jgi:hypothetical protein